MTLANGSIVQQNAMDRAEEAIKAIPPEQQTPDEKRLISLLESR